MKNKWKLIISFFAIFTTMTVVGFIVKIPMYKPVQFNAVKISNSYRYFVSIGNIQKKDINKLKLSQNGIDYIVDLDLVNFNDNKTIEIKSIDKTIDTNLITKATVVLNSERIMYYLINKTFSRK